MNRNTDFDRFAQSWLQDGPTQMPDRSLQAALDEVHVTSQRRFGAARRTFIVNGNVFKLAAAAVVGLLVVVPGGIYLGSSQSSGQGGPPAATSAPTATAAPTPTASNAPTTAPTLEPTASLSAASQPPPLDAASVTPCDAAGDGCVKAGTYRLSGGPAIWPATVSIDVPEGWFDLRLGSGWEAVLVGDANGPGSGWGVMFYTVGDVARDPCDSSKGWIPATQVDTPQKLATAMAAWPRFTATTPRPITTDGHRGLKFQLKSTAKASCEPRPAGGATSAGNAGHSATGASIDVYPMVDPSGAHDPVTVEIVDTDNGLLVIRATDFPQTSPAEVSGGLSPNPTFHTRDQADLHAILDSIRLTAQPATP